MQLIEYVRALENRDNHTRGQQVLHALRTLGIEPTVQECRRPKIINIVVDFCRDPEPKRLLFTAHYDAARGSPGANDNASGVAVLIGLCRELKHTGTPIRVCFFDREEAWFRTPIIRFGLLGSLYYVWKSDRRNIIAACNLEFCGLGDFLGIWPIRSNETELAIVKEVAKAANRLCLSFKLVDVPWLFLNSDHLSFRIRGVSNAITLSLLPSNQIPILDNLLAHLSIPRLLVGQRPSLPKPLSFIHTDKDTSSQLSEKSLRLMLALLLELIQSYRIALLNNRI